MERIRQATIQAVGLLIRLHLDATDGLIPSCCHVNVALHHRLASGRIGKANDRMRRHQLGKLAPPAKDVSRSLP